KQRQLDYHVLEKGILVNSIYRFPRHMIFFTTPDLLEIGGLPLVSPYEKPTRLEALRYYRRVVEAYELDITYGEAVLDVIPAAEQIDGPVFAIETRSSRGVRRVRHARSVVMAIGYYDHPNLINVPGEDLPHVSHYYEEAHPYYLQRVAVVGGGNSAAETALELYRAGAKVTLIHRHAELKPTIKYWVRPDIENRIKEGSIAARFNTRVLEIRPTELVLEGLAGREELPADSVLLLTGYHADSDLLVRAGVQCDVVSFKPSHDPTTFETNVPGLFLAGGVVSGRDTSGIFIENGRFHGEAIVKAIGERLAMAKR
ncbi:MAG: YpdA family putative bacillithiol disulfide reductase, partial [Vicinamibacterales bacterium]